MSDPFAQSRSRSRTLRFVQVVALIACTVLAWWAFKPLTSSHDERSGQFSQPANKMPPASKSTLDVLAYAAPLWVAPPPPPAPAPAAVPSPPPPPLRLQLLAIVKEDGGYKALIYDPDADKLILAATGELVGGQSISRIDATQIELKGQGVGTRTLALRTPNPGGTP